jgi:hypothetical protein
VVEELPDSRQRCLGRSRRAEPAMDQREDGQGFTIYDIGLPKGMTDLGPFYKAELEEIAKRLYPTIKIPWP